MPIEFRLTDRFLGWAQHTGTPDEIVAVRNAELISPDDAVRVQEALQQLQRAILDHISGLPKPPSIAHLLVIIRHDLSGIAYVNELAVIAKVRPAKDIVASQPIVTADIASIEEVTFNDIDVPDDAALIVISTLDWRRSVYYDLGPMAPDPTPRIGPLSRILAQQITMLWGIARAPEVPARTRIDAMADGYQRLRSLLAARCEEEVRYQEVLEDHPWMLGLGRFNRFQRHARLDGENIPDFTGRRAFDNNDDIVELKQPFLQCFRENGDFSGPFLQAWDQAERYLTLARDQRSYLREEKGMRFETPRCLLLIGTEWSESETRAIRRKEINNTSIHVMTYNQLLQQAAEVLSVMRTALLSE